MLLLLAVSPELLTTQEEATTSFFIEAIKKRVQASSQQLMWHEVGPSLIAKFGHTNQASSNAGNISTCTNIPIYE